jgi:hypothetical protein
MWLGPEGTREGEEAIVAISVSRGGAKAIIKHIGRKDGDVWLTPQARWFRPS